MQRNSQFGLSTALMAVVLAAVFFAAVRYLGFAVLIFGSFLAGVTLGLWVSYKRKHSALDCAVIGGVVGCVFGELIGLIADPPIHWHPVHVSNMGFIACLSSIGGLVLGFVFRISYASFRTTTDKENQNRACKISLAIVATVAVVLFSVVYAMAWLNTPRPAGS